ncbi:MAG TPA: hypothetical protein VEY91_12370 [Candidatus Limnocylindria bacterium]|nr:hypothetical protein [Candidatus Limnocylindria bacterium]
MRLLLLVLLVIAAWYGWKSYPGLVARRPGHEAVVENASRSQLVRVRLSVNGQTFAKEVMAHGDQAKFAFRVNEDATFRLVWEVTGRMGEVTWIGGRVPIGPILQRHYFRIEENGKVIHRSENKADAAPAR